MSTLIPWNISTSPSCFTLQHVTQFFEYTLHTQLLSVILKIQYIMLSRKSSKIIVAWTCRNHISTRWPTTDNLPTNQSHHNHNALFKGVVLSWCSCDVAGLEEVCHLWATVYKKQTQYVAVVQLVGRSHQITVTQPVAVYPNSRHWIHVLELKIAKLVLLLLHYRSKCTHKLTVHGSYHTAHPIRPPPT